MNKLFIGLITASMIMTSCKEDQNEISSNTTELQITTPEYLTEASSIWLRIEGGAPPYEVQYTPENPTADTDLIIIEEQKYDGDIYLDHGYNFTRESERNLSPGKYKFKVTDADGTIKTKTVVNKGFIIQYDPTNRLMHSGKNLEWSGYSGDIEVYNNNGLTFSANFGQEAYYDYSRPRLWISAPEGVNFPDGTTDFFSSSIGSVTSNQLQIQLETVSNNNWSVMYNTNNVSNQSGSISIDIISDNSNGYGLSYLKIDFTSVNLEGYDLSTSSNSQTVLSGVIYATYYEGD